MVNFKQWVLPLMVGIMSVRAADPEPAEPEPKCEFSVDNETHKISAVSSCPEDKIGTYFFNPTILNEGDAVTYTPELIKIKAAGEFEKVDVPGYYKVENGSIVECKAKKIGEIKCEIMNTSDSLINSCSDLGKYKSGDFGSIIIGCSTSASYALPFATPVSQKTRKRSDEDTREYFLSKYAPDHAFGFDASVTYYALKVDENSITFDQTVTLSNVMLNKETGKVVLNRKDDFCSDQSEEIFVSCTNGKCNHRKQSDYDTIIPNDNICTIGDVKVVEVDKTTTFLASNCNEKSGYYLGQKLNKDGELVDVLCKIDEYATDCSEPAKIARGYYWNEVYYNEIIGCDDRRNCKKLELKHATSCTAELANQIIDTGYSVYYCTEDNHKKSLNDMVDDIKNSDEPKIFSGRSASIFDNADAKYSITTDEKSIKVNLEISDDTYKNGQSISSPCTVTIGSGGTSCSTSHCDSTYYDGYQFLNVNSTVIDNDQKDGILVKLEKNSPNQCTVITNTPGFYVNQMESTKDKYPLIYCDPTTNACRLKKTSMFEYISLPGGSDEDNQIHYYYLNQEDTKNKPIIVCYQSEQDEVEFECKASAALKNYYLNSSQTFYSNTRTVIECTRSTIDGTITCTEQVMSGNKHYPIMDIDGKDVINVMKCDGDECHEVRERKKNNEFDDDNSAIKKVLNPTGVKEYVVINGLKPSEIIRCNLYVDNCIIQKGNKETSADANTVYYIDSAAPAETLGLIKCSPNGADCVHVTGADRFAYITEIEDKIIVCSSTEFCKYETIEDDGYYLNGGEGKVLIYNEQTKKDPTGKDITEIGDDVKRGLITVDGVADQIYKNSGVININDNYLILCTETTKCTDIKTISGKKYLNIQKEIPEILYDYGDIDSKVDGGDYKIDDNEKRGFLVDPNTFRILTDNSVEGKLVVCTHTHINDDPETDANESDDKYKCEFTSSSDNYYINGNNDNNEKELIQFKDSKFNLIRGSPGYYINSDYIIECRSSTCIKYKVPTDLLTEEGKCQPNKVGQISSTNAICVKEGEEPVSISSFSGKYFVSANAKFNALGVNNGDVVLNFNSNSIVNINDNFTENSYLCIKTDGKVSENKDEACDLYSRTLGGYKKEIISSGSHYYPNGDKTKAYTLPKIKCVFDSGTTTCSLQADGSSEIYCAATKLYQCSATKCPEKDIGNDQNCVPVDKVDINRYYLNEADNISLIKCSSETSCSPKTDIIDGYYLSGNPSKPLIKCSVSFNKKRCVYETPSDGYYIANDEGDDRNVYQFNKRTDYPNGKLIYCKNGFCENETNINNNKWYVSNDNLLIYCKRTGCEKQYVPNEGWYVNRNGDSDDGKYLIKCTSSKTSKGDIKYNCVESTIINDGYYINAGKAYYGEEIIKCTSGDKCVEMNVDDGYYYINGVDRKLIYCSDNHVCVATEPSTNLYTTWYLTDPNTSLIGCSKSGICELYENPSQKGYYMNGDKNKSKYPLIRYNYRGRGYKFCPSDDHLENGWYKNGDLNAGKTEMVIRCDNANSCKYVEVQDKKCEELSGTGFTIANGYLEWCSTDKTGFRLEGNGNNKVVTALFKSDNTIPGVNLVSEKGEHFALVDISQDKVEKKKGEQYALVEISQDSVISFTGKDGYYRYYNKLYKCPKRNNGVCTKVEDLKDGYYFNYGNGVNVYECNSNEYNLCKTINRNNNRYDISYIISRIGGNNEKIESLENESIAAFNVKDLGFPGIAESDEYILTDVSKYAIKYKENIEVKCTAKGKYAYGPSPGCEQKSDTDYYDFETNKGFYVFNGNKKLTKVYIPKGDETREYKLYCEIGDLCVEKEISKEDIINYKLSDDKILLAERKGINEVEVVPLVLRGTYLSKKADGTYVKIICKITGDCVERSITSNSGEGISINNGIIKFKNDKKEDILASKFYPTKYVLQKRTDSGDEIYPMNTVLELTQTSYTWTDETRNIFVDSNDVMISTEYKDVKTGYICKKGNCSEVKKTNNIVKYYINTAQLGKNVNAYVECSDICRMKSLSDDNSIVLVPNAAADGVEDALISCKLDKGCETVATTSESGLPDCKLHTYIVDNNNIDSSINIYNVGEKIYKANGEALSINKQYCLHNGVPVKYSYDYKVLGNGLYMFNEGLEYVDYTQITEDYINASLYYCISGKCSRTYGYLSLINLSNNSYAKCTKTGCKIVNESGSCKLYGAGSMLDGKNICLTNSDSDKQTGASGTKYYPISIDIEGSFPEVGIASKIIVAVNTYGKYVLNENGYVLLSGNDIVTSTSSKNNVLYKCTSEDMNCVKVTKPRKGYYKNLFGNVIDCTGEECITNSMVVKFSAPGEIKYEYDNDNYIYEINENEKIRLSDIDGYILLKNDMDVADFPERASKLYLCNSSTGKCEKVSPKQDGWYISYKGNGNAIHCENTLCYTKELKTQCSGVGELIYKNNNYYVCKDKKSTDTKSIDQMLGKVLKLDSSGEYYGGSDYVSYGINNVIAIGNTNLSKKDTTNEEYKPLSACGVSDRCKDIKKDEYCIFSDTTLYRRTETVNAGTTSVSCNPVEGIVMLYGNKDATFDDNEDKYGAQLYNCVKSGSTNSCRIVTGYFKNIKCDYNGCYKKANNNYGNNEGSLTSSGLKVGSNNKVADTTVKYYYISGENSFPGSGNKKGVLVQSGKQDTTDAYYIIFKGEGYYLLNSDKILSADEDSNKQNNSLYLCKDLECVKQTNAANGYYKNAAAEKATGIIICRKPASGESKCKIADQKLDYTGEVVYTDNAQFNCTEKTVGRIVRNKEKAVYNICYGNNNRKEFTSNAATTQYYFMNLKHGNRFANVELKTDAVKNENDTATILLKITNLSITQVSIDGYILSSGTSLLETASKTASGTLYYCEYKNYETQGTQGPEGKTNQCYEVKDKKSGWYFNKYFNDLRYIKCTESQCNVVEANDSRECVGSGSLVYNGGKLKVCENGGKQVEIEKLSAIENVMMNVEKSTEFPSVRNDKTDIIINRSALNVTLTKMDSYVVVKEVETRMVVSLGLDKNISSDEGSLYKCESSGSCVKVQYSKDNWYLYGVSGKANQLIKCNDRKCKMYNPAQGFYISANVLKPLIQCIQPGNVKDTGELIIEDGKVKENIVCFERNPVEGWFVNADNTNVDKGLIRCTAEKGCEITTVANGWYVNAGASYSYEKLTNRTITNIIQCGKNDNCDLYEKEIKNACSKGGEVVKVNNSYRICRSAESNDYVDFSKENVEIIDVVAANDFPDAESGKTAVSVKKEKVAQADEDGYYYKNSAMYKCERKRCTEIVDNESNDMIVFNVLSKTLYLATCAENACTWTEQKDEGYYFVQLKDGKTKLYTYEDDPNFTNLSIYYCRKKDKEMKCYDVTGSDGYMHNPSHMVEGKKDNDNLYLKSGSTYKLVSMGSEKKVTSKLRLCTEFKPNYCYISYDNEPYTNDTENYVSSTNLPKDIEAGSICISSNGLMYFATKTIDTGLDEMNCVAIPRGSDNSYSYQTINVGKSNEKTYLVDVFGARTAEKEIEYDGASCTYDIKTGNCKAVGNDIINAGDYCKSTTGEGILYLARARVTNAGASCVKYESNNNDFVQDPRVDTKRSKQYYLINGGLYTIDELKVEKIEKGIYLTNAVNYKVTINNGQSISITDESDYNMYVCTEEGCVKKTKCVSNVGFEYLLDYESQQVVKCDPLTNTITEINAPGYYVNSVTSNLIKCYDDGKCLEVKTENAMEGYYKDSGNSNKMIVCVRNEEEFSCTEENVIECTYNETKGTCTASTDLLRNSYCYFRKEDKVYGLIEKYIYVSKFIKTGSEGRCIAGVEEDLYVKERESKFLGHEVRGDLIRISIDSIVSIYENNIGYYLIDTKEGKGIVATSGTPEKKTRFYVCRKNNCEEELPVNKKIYVNKASSKKLVRYYSSFNVLGGMNANSGYWYVINGGCRMHKINTIICDMDPPEYKTTVSKFGIVYRDQHDAVTLYDNIYDVKGKMRLDYHKELKNNTFVEYKDDLYLFDLDGQSFTVQDSGPYVFERPENDNYNFNLAAYKSNRNETNIEYLVLPRNYDLGDEGYYINKADMENLGIVIQKMKIEQKLEPPEVLEDGTTTEVPEPEIISKYKAVISKCSSVKKNFCKTVEGTADVDQGGVCVVTDGEFKGLYLAVESIKKSSDGRNCIKYEKGGTYKMFDKEIYFSGSRLKNNIIRVSSDKIEPFPHNIKYDNTYETGIYVFTETEDKYLVKFNAADFTSAVAYKCGKKVIPADEEGEQDEYTYACETFSEPSGIYLTKPGGSYENPVDVMEYKNKRWRNVSELGYYFFMDNYKPSNVTYSEDGETVDYPPVIFDYRRAFGGVSIDNNGRYMNKPVKDILIEYDADSNEENKLTMKTDVKNCTVNVKDGTCGNGGNDLEKDDACIGQDGKLYVVDIIENEEDEVDDTVMCYTGSVDKLKYALIDEKKLYMLDGMSIKSMGKGYYIFDEKMEAFSSKYPVKPSKIVYCNEIDQCQLLTRKLDIDQDVIVNEAKKSISTSRSLLKYYAGEFGEERFMNVKKNGYYCLNEDGVIRLSEAGDVDDAYDCWTKDNSNVINMNLCDSKDICINSAKSSGDIVIAEGKNKILSAIKVNYEKGYIQLNKEYNLDDSKIIYKTFNDKLYKLKKEKLEHVSDGLYLLTSDGKAFIDTEPTTIAAKQICYYVNGSCSIDEMKKYREHKYVINRAAIPNTVVTYDKDNDKWATVSEDGYYFFFVLNNGQPYSVDPEDRRVYTGESEVRVKHIVDGKIIPDEDIIFNNGMYLTKDRTNDLVVGRVGGNWYDAEYVDDNVEGISRRRCTAIETDGKIGVDEYCYSDKFGICMPKSTITDKTKNEANCISSDGDVNYFYFTNGALYIVNDYSYQRISHDGLFVIDNDNLPYSGKMEGDANAYLCEESGCSKVTELESMYYLNAASLEVGEDVILYYNSESGSWRTVDEDGNYLFNKSSYAVSADEDVAYYYKVTKNGNVIERKSIKGTTVVSKSKSEGVYSGQDGKAKALESCSISGTDVTTSAALEVGDLCVDGNNVVIISDVPKAGKRQEGSYAGVTASTEGKKYALVGNQLVVIDVDTVVALNLKGYIVVDDATSLPLESVDAVEATVYKCGDEGCVLADNEEFVEGKNYINSAGENSLVRYSGNGQWQVENVEGYYFIDENMKGVEVGVFADTIYEVQIINGELIQEDVTEENMIGFYMNRANEKKNIISNNNKYWSEGQEINKCIATEFKEKEDEVEVVRGIVCKTDNNNPEGYPAGQYCYADKTEQLYFLIQPITNASATVNCVYGTEEKTKFVYFDKNGGKLNGETLKYQLLKVDQEGVREAENGYYILDKDNYLVEEVVVPTGEDEKQEYTIYKCDESGCKSKELASETVFQTHDGKIYEIDENGNIGKISKDGLYFFDIDGDICDKDNTEVGTIINVTGGIEMKLPLDSMREGAYVNDGNGIYVGKYESGQWSIIDVECEVDANDGMCSSTKVEMDLGSYCSVEGKLYVVSSITEDSSRKCIAGNDEKPVFIKTEDDKLVVVGEKGVFTINEEEGYYAINNSTLQALESEESIGAQFVLCEFGGECKKYTPEVGRYINRSTGEVNIAVFEEAGASEASTIDSKCTVEGNVCSVVEGTLEVGDVCINENYIYVISSNNGDCLKAKKAVITYQLINNKMYMLTDDAVVQKNDGYFFINSDNRAITRKSDYSKPDTVGYICSNKGDCYDIEPTELSYFADYTTKSSRRFNVVKFDPSLKSSKRDGSSGYEVINEEGIYKLDDGAYAECSMNDIDEVDCHDIQEVGSYITIDGEVIKCVEGEEGEIECTQAAEGGYYVIDGKLMECDVNEDGDQLVCEEMDKEGYFITQPDGELWECVEKVEDEQAAVPTDDVEVSKILDKLNAEAPAEAETEGEKSNGENSDDTTTEVESTTTTTIETTTTTFEDYTPTPVAVECAPVECKVGKVIYQKDENGREIEESPIYICKSVKDGVNKFDTETECDSGNFVKGKDGFYICEGDKNDVDEEKMEKPNDDHTKDYTPVKTTTTTTTTTTEKPAETTTTKTTTKPPASTTVQPTSKPTTAGASSLYRKLPTFTFYLVIFILSYFLLF